MLENRTRSLAQIGRISRQPPRRVHNIPAFRVTQHYSPVKDRLAWGIMSVVFFFDKNSRMSSTKDLPPQSTGNVLSPLFTPSLGAFHCRDTAFSCRRGLFDVTPKERSSFLGMHRRLLFVAPLLLLSRAVDIPVESIPRGFDAHNVRPWNS